MFGLHHGCPGGSCHHDGSRSRPAKPKLEQNFQLVCVCGKGGGGCDMHLREGGTVEPPLSRLPLSANHTHIQPLIYMPPGGS